MMRPRSVRTHMCGALVALCTAAAGSIASAVSVNFENPPYATGAVVGQDGWAATAYFPTPNGNVAVSNSSPLAGAQSLSYTRTEQGLAPNGSDVVKADVINVFKNGSAAADLTASFLISSTSLSGQGLGFGVDGLFLSPAGASGVTPIGVRLNNAGSSIPSIEVYGDLAGAPAWYYFGGSLAAASFPENNTLEFTLDVDFDASTYTVSYRNLTAGTPLVTSGSPFGFAVPYVAKPNGSFDVDVIAAFRYGAGQIDNINLTGNVPEPTAASLGVIGLGVLGLGRCKRRAMHA